MKTIKKELQIGKVTVITTTFNRKQNGVTEVLVDNNNYDTMYDQCTIETELSNNTDLLLIDLFKNF
jgi:hypothetical protein